MTPPSRARLAGIVLAAGTSSRMEGRSKLLLSWEDGVVVQGPVRAALEAGLDPVVVVTGHRGEEVRRELEERFGPAGPGPPPEGGAAGRLRFVRNPRFARGQSTSLARGARAVRTVTDAAAAAVLLGDEPRVGADAVRRTVEAWRRRASAGGRPPVVRARYRDRPGHPVVFPRDAFAGLESLEGDRGARAWLERNADRVEEVRLGEDAPADVDTVEDYRRLAGDGDGGPPDPAGRS